MLGKLLERGAADGQRREIAITKEEFLIGRGADCDLRLRMSAISRHHCLLRIRQGEATLADLGSANGTFVNGQRIRSQTALKDRDEIKVGECSFVLALYGQSGIDWGPETGSAPEMPTSRLERPRGARNADGPTTDEGHPPSAGAG